MKLLGIFKTNKTKTVSSLYQYIKSLRPNVHSVSKYKKSVPLTDVQPVIASSGIDGKLLYQQIQNVQPNRLVLVFTSNNPEMVRIKLF